ncbi:MAG: nucleotidyltransferase family protein [Treponema sp.]|jgi:molybdenum cofactor cytidylyltransferase|nr:nucleotidyltransferase family protein [Treponema sp.]
MRCYAILLAAGFSRRFGGKNKLLAPFRGKPLARHTLELVCGMGCFEKVFFVYADEAVAALAEGLSVTAVYNPAPEKGHGESARLGLMAAKKSDCHQNESFLFHSQKVTDTYLMFFPCDQPLLDQDTVRLLLDSARPGCIAEPVCPGGNHSPSLFSASFTDELLALKEGEHPRLLKTRHPQALITVKIAGPAVLADIDTIEDMEKLL